MPLTTSPSQADASPPVRAGRRTWAGRLAWWAGWLLLVLISMTITYGELVLGGR